MSGLYPFFRVLIIAVFFTIASCGGEPRDISAAPANPELPNSIAHSSRHNNVAVPQLMWSPPRARENGDYLELDEIAGYEIRYQNEKGDYVYLSVDTFITQLPVTQLSGEQSIPQPVSEPSTHELPQNATFEIAAYDTQGRYSEFVPIHPH